MGETNRDMEFRRYLVRGRVQGVGFRWWTRKAARALGLVGRVWNEPDGSVEVRVGGTSGALDRLEAQLRQGPALARVSAVERRAVGGEPAGLPWTDFDIDSE